MSYSDFIVDDLKTKFELNFIEDQHLFTNVGTYDVPTHLTDRLEHYIPIAVAVNTEKARSEAIVSHILLELKIQLKTIGYFSGIDFTVDKNAGLSGRCDFILSKSSSQYALDAPVVVMVEAKNDNIINSIGQCGAEMVGAQLFNTKKIIQLKLFMDALQLELFGNSSNL